MSNRPCRKTVKYESVDGKTYGYSQNSKVKDDSQSLKSMDLDEGNTNGFDLYRGRIWKSTCVVKAVRSTKTMGNNGYSELYTEEIGKKVLFYGMTDETGIKANLQDNMAEDAKLFLHFVKRVRALDEIHVMNESTNYSDIETFNTAKSSPSESTCSYEYIDRIPAITCQSVESNNKVTQLDSNDVIKVDTVSRVANFPVEDNKEKKTSSEIKCNKVVVTHAGRSTPARLYSYTEQDYGSKPVNNMKMDGDTLSEMLSVNAHAKVEHARRKNNEGSILDVTVESQSMVTARWRVK